MKPHAIVFALFVSGCAATIEAPPTEATLVTKAPVATNPHVHTKLLCDALDEVSLRPDQRPEIDELTAHVEARHEARALKSKAVLLAIAARVEDGTLEPAALRPDLDELREQTGAVRTADVAALSRLHDLLDDAQRRELAGALGRRKSAKHGVGGRDQRAWVAGYWRTLTSELNLSDEQRPKIDSAIRAAFEEESAARDREPAAVGDVAAAVSIVGAAAKVVPLLTPDQRKAAANRLRLLAIR